MCGVGGQGRRLIARLIDKREIWSSNPDAGNLVALSNSLRECRE